jgi:hypothetical protein
MTFKAINDIASSNSFVLTLLVFGAYLRMTEQDLLSLTVAQQAAAVKKAMLELCKLQAER